MPVRQFAHENPRVLILWKGNSRTGQQGLILLNKDSHHRQQVWFDSFSRFFSKPGTLRCVSPENPMPEVHQPFHYDLRPGEAVVIVSDPTEPRKESPKARLMTHEMGCKVEKEREPPH